MGPGEVLSYIGAAGDIAIKAGDVLLGGLYNKDKIVEFKGDINLVTEMDRRAEELIKNHLSDRFPDIAMLAEEGGESGDFSGRRWIVDPLDGTTSYAHGLPHFSVSIALEEDGEVIAGVVYNPCADECFSAVRGGGASLNGQKINVSGTSILKRSLLATGFPYDRATSKDNNVDNFNAFILKAQGIRRMGSAALDLCYTAAGRFDGYWEMKLSPWDSAAGSVILEEAGGRISDFSGGPYSIYGKELLVSNRLIHDEMITVLNGN
ncbi:MAG: inositol monophosphatase [Proteobacteria bacterium]|nr:inositol monophosphatase [Pseudomonadota bacterium]